MIKEKYVKSLTQKGLTITITESRTGGLLASRLVNVPGKRGFQIACSLLLI